MNELQNTRHSGSETRAETRLDWDSIQVNREPHDAMKIPAEQIWNEFSGRLSQFIRSRVNDPTVAEDILHDVFAKYQARCEEFRDSAKVQGWLFLVARNAVIDHYRTRKSTSEVTESLAAEPLQTLEIAELHAAFQRLIDSLPEPYHEAIVLVELEGLTQGELAKRLGISLSAAKSRVQRGREQLKELLLDFCQREFRSFGRHSPCPNGLVPPPDEAREILQQMRSGRKTRSRE